MATKNEKNRVVIKVVWMLLIGPVQLCLADLHIQWSSYRTPVTVQRDCTINTLWTHGFFQGGVLLTFSRSSNHVETRTLCFCQLSDEVRGRREGQILPHPIPPGSTASQDASAVPDTELLPLFSKRKKNLFHSWSPGEEMLAVVVVLKEFLHPCMAQTPLL